MTATYFLVGRAIVEEEQRGAERAAYGEELLARLGADLSTRFGRGVSRQNLQSRRLFYGTYRDEIRQTLSGRSLVPRIRQTASGGSELTQLAARFPLPWSHYVLLISARSPEARAFYETEALRGGWTVRQFLLELGGDFAFIGRQRRLRVGDVWYAVDLLFFHRVLRCLVVVDLKLEAFTHADAGQMHLYLNYAREHWTRPGENPPVGLILCTKKDAAVAKYALEGLSNKVLAAEYRTTLPTEKALVKELVDTRRRLEERARRR